MISINKRLLMLLSFIMFFALIGSASAVSNDGSSDGLSLNVSGEDSIEALSAISDDGSIDAPSDLSESNAEEYEKLVSNDNSPENLNANSNEDDVTIANLEASDVSSSGWNGQKSSNSKLNSPSDSNSNLISATNSNMLPQYVKVNDSKYYSSNSDIQKIIDNASPGSTIEFTGSFYKDLRLKINKPLNIISKCGTVINMSFDLPVFAISAGGSGTNITGFVINTAGSFVEASDVSNINVMKNRISAKKIAISFKNVINSKIANNQFTSFKTAILIHKSKGISISKNDIVPDSGDNVGINIVDCTGSGGVRIYDNRLIGFNANSYSTGINIGRNVSNVVMKGNTITDWRIGVHFLDSIVNFTIYNNTISHNGDGLVLDKGKMTHLNFTKNILSENLGEGFLFDYQFEGATDDPVFENNIFSKNGGMAVRSSGLKGFNIGKNFLNGNKLCVKIKMKKGFSIKFRQNGNKVFASVLGDNGWTRDLPDFEATLNINGKNYNVLFRNGIAYVELDGSGGGSGSGLSSSTFTVGDETKSLDKWGPVQKVSFDEIMPYVQEYLDSFQTSESNQNYDDYEDYEDYDDYNDNPYGHNSNSNSPSGNSGLYNGSSSVGSSSNPLASTGSAGASSAGASASSVQSAPSDSVTAKTLSVDEETFRVVGVGGLVFLILLVIGLYYRDDIREMMKD